MNGVRKKCNLEAAGHREDCKCLRLRFNRAGAPKYRVHSDVALSEEHTVTLILYYVAFMIGGDLAAYFLGLLVEYEWGKQASLLVFLALGLVGARSLGNYTESRHIKCEMKAPWMNPGVRELAALSALAALGCGLAAGQGDLLFVALLAPPA